MSTVDARTVPLDPTSRERLAAGGLDYRIVSGEGDPFAGFMRAVDRGFLEAEPSDAQIDGARMSLGERGARLVGVYDEATGGQTPVSTIDSWVTPTTVPGGELDMWAISVVTVAGTHRRRGIARAMLEGELRAAAGAGLAMAGLTVTEATIYGRYGFGPAVPVVELTVDAAKAGWRAYQPQARLQYVERPRLAEALGEVHERVRTRRAGNIPGWSGRWRGFAGTSPGAKDGDKIRGVIAVDAEGATVGAMAYSLKENGADYTRHTFAISHLVADTPDAYAALWRFAVQHDLVATVTAGLQPLDAALPWLVADERAVSQRVMDHGWLRILDVARALEGRAYSADVSAVIRTHDPLDIAAGTWRVEIVSGRASVTATDEEPDVEIGIAELSSVYLGAVPLTGLGEAGRATGDAEVLTALDRALRTDRAPHLSIVY